MSLSLWRNRLTTLEAVVLLMTARFVVRHVRLGRWRGSLGLTVPNDPETRPRAPAVSREDLARAAQLASAVDRASARLPGENRCFPRAIALQWMLRRRNIDSTLVVAVLAGAPEPGEDLYHAWVERDDRILIGHCDPAQYRPLLTISQSAEAYSGPPRTSV